MGPNSIGGFQETDPWAFTRDRKQPRSQGLRGNANEVGLQDVLSGPQFLSLLESNMADDLDDE